MNKLTKIGGILIALVALAALIGSTMTFAQDDELVAPVAPQEEGVPGPHLGKNGRFGQRGRQLFDKEAYQAALADELGITVEELTAAQEAAKETVIQQLVTDGTITQEQADAILSGEGLRGGFEPLLQREEITAVIAETLGITVEELEAAHDEGKTLTDLAEEQGIEMETVQAAIQEAHEAAVLQAVEDGTITQEQADWMLEHGANGRGGPRGNGGFGRGGHRGGPQGGFGPGGSQGSPADDSPTFAPQG
ncbi:MAG: hypothetical protein GY796_13215 [Chloroflexi bacterium]|nr:hypothetical protein [Chloroflexota bacterium]